MLRFIIATVSLALIAPGSAIFAQEEIVIGEYASLTGGSASFGQSSHKGTALAIDEINAAGGVLGKKLKLITEDDQSQAGQPATIARKLISQDKVVAVLGEVASSKSLEAAPICQQNKIPMISPASTNPKVTEVGDYIFRVCFIDPFPRHGDVEICAIKGLEERRRADRREAGLQRGSGGILHQGLQGQRRQDRQGAEIFNRRQGLQTAADLDQGCESRRDIRPGLLCAKFRSSPSRPGSSASRCRCLAATAGWAIRCSKSRATRSMARSFPATSRADDKSPKVQEFVKNFKAKYGEVPDDMAALGYDSAMILGRSDQARAGTTEPRKAPRMPSRRPRIMTASPERSRSTPSATPRNRRSSSR